MGKSMPFLLVVFLLGFASFADAQTPLHTVCAIGDSQVERGSPLITALRRELGSEYQVLPMGRRGWSTRGWIRAGDFAETCEGADIVLVSLGGNDIAQGRSPERIQANVDLLVATLPPGVRVYHMPVPRVYRRSWTDGVHLTRRGAREYARMITPHLTGQD